MSLDPVAGAASWPMVLPYLEGKVPASFPGPTGDYLETSLDTMEYLIENVGRELHVFGVAKHAIHSPR